MIASVALSDLAKSHSEGSALASPLSILGPGTVLPLNIDGGKLGRNGWY